MDKRASHLATLGLAPDASWDEVTLAYKDLMRVWHPDRFQGDERLRLKAESQAQRINEAMSELRKLGKEVPKTARTQSSQSSKTGASKSDAARSGSTQHTANSKRDSKRQQRESRATSQNDSFIIAPLYVRQRLATSLLRVVAASAILYAAYIALQKTSATMPQEAAALGFAFLALDLGARNLAIMLLPRPVISVERSGLFFLKTGRLAWNEIESAWPVMTSRYYQLNLMLSQQHLSKRNIFVRTLLRFRRWAKAPHIVIPFNGLTADPVSVINAMRLRQIHQDVTIEESRKNGAIWLILAFAVSLACVLLALFRCYIGSMTDPVTYLPYFIIFGICRAAGVFMRMGSSSSL